MNYAVLLIIAAGILGVLGVTMIVWPRRWARFAQFGMYEDSPTPSAWYVGSIRVSGIIVVLGSLALIALGSQLLAPPAAAPTTSPSVGQQTSDVAELRERCDSALPILDDAVVTDEAGLIANVEELETLAAENGVGVRAPGGDADDGTALIVTIDGYPAFAVPDPPAGACASFVQRVITG